MNKWYYYHFLIIPTKNPQYKKNWISFSALLHLPYEPKIVDKNIPSRSKYLKIGRQNDQSLEVDQRSYIFFISLIFFGSGWLLAHKWSEKKYCIVNWIRVDTVPRIFFLMSYFGKGPSINLNLPAMIKPSIWGFSQHLYNSGCKNSNL